MQAIKPLPLKLLQNHTHRIPNHLLTPATTALACQPTNHDRLPPTATRRPFITNPFASPQNFKVTRTLRHSPDVIFDVISDVASYSHFLPFCTSSVVTKLSNPAHNGKTYPEEAKLGIGFADAFGDEYYSRVYCVPYSTVEAVSGDSMTTLDPEEIRHHNPRPAPDQDPARRATLLSRLSTKWHLTPGTRGADVKSMSGYTSQPAGQQETEVSLELLVQFASPAHAAFTAAALPKMVEKMIGAFEKRVEEIVQGEGNE